MPIFYCLCTTILSYQGMTLTVMRSLGVEWYNVVAAMPVSNCEPRRVTISWKKKREWGGQERREGSLPVGMAVTCMVSVTTVLRVRDDVLTFAGQGHCGTYDFLV